MKMGSMTDQNANGSAVSVACLTDTGRVRSANEDAFVVAEFLESEVKAINGDLDDHRVGPDGLLLAVSDGMGGAQAGEVASRLAIELVMPAGKLLRSQEWAPL
jgi:protein phosphatase